MKKYLVLLLLGIFSNQVNSSTIIQDQSAISKIAHESGSDIIDAHKASIKIALKKATDEKGKLRVQTYGARGKRELEEKYNTHIQSLKKDQKNIDSKTPAAIAKREINKKLRWPLLKSYANFLVKDKLFHLGMKSHKIEDKVKKSSNDDSTLNNFSRERDRFNGDVDRLRENAVKLSRVDMYSSIIYAVRTFKG